MRVLFGDCTFDSEARTLVRGGEPVRISGKAFQLLEMLIAARPNPIEKSDLFARLWPDTFVSEANLASLIKEIRAATGDDARAPRFVRTVHRFGYAFSAPATETPEKSGIDSIAVLPFANRSGNPDLDYLADGLAVVVGTAVSVAVVMVVSVVAVVSVAVTAAGSSDFRGSFSVQATLPTTRMVMAANFRMVFMCFRSPSYVKIGQKAAGVLNRP